MIVQLSCDIRLGYVMNRLLWFVIRTEIVKQCVARSNMLKGQLYTTGLQYGALADAMLEVSREVFVPDAFAGSAYVDDVIALGGGRYMLSPHMLATMLDAVEFEGHERTLIIGGGTGYSAEVVKHLCDKVVMVEERADLVSKARAQVEDVDVNTAPLSSGCAVHQPYDVIIIEGAVEKVPQVLLDQLVDGGRLVTVESAGVLAKGQVLVIEKHGDAYSELRGEQLSIPALAGFSENEEFSF